MIGPRIHPGIFGVAQPLYIRREPTDGLIRPGVGGMIGAEGEGV